MCGRFGLTQSPAALLARLHARSNAPFRPRYNVAPQQPVLAVRNEPERVAEELIWSLIPESEPTEQRLSTFNARSEGLASSRLHAPLVPNQRAVVLADGWYEWRRETDGSRLPFWVHHPDGEPFAFAALWDRRGGERGPLTCTIVTRAATPELATVHERMPVALGDDALEAWLAPEPLPLPEALAVLDGGAQRAWSFHPVSRAVGNVRNDVPELTAPVEDLRIALPGL